MSTGSGFEAAALQSAQRPKNTDRVGENVLAGFMHDWHAGIVGGAQNLAFERPLTGASVPPVKLEGATHADRSCDFRPLLAAPKADAAAEEATKKALAHV